MSLLKRRDPYPTDAVRDKVAKRVARLSNTEMFDWADVAGSGIARSLREYQRSQDPLWLKDAQDGISALQGVVDTLSRRADK